MLVADGRVGTAAIVQPYGIPGAQGGEKLASAQSALAYTYDLSP